MEPNHLLLLENIYTFTMSIEETCTCHTRKKNNFGVQNRIIHDTTSYSVSYHPPLSLLHQACFFFLHFVGVSVDICYPAPCKLVHPRFSNNTTDLWFHMWEWFRCAPVRRRSHPQQSRKILLVRSTSSRPQHPGSSIFVKHILEISHTWKIYF